VSLSVLAAVFIVPEAFEQTRTWTGVIATVGFLVVFAVDVAG
jgi:ZIP family zinc transporter